MNGTPAAFLAIPEALLLALVLAGAGRRLIGALLPDATPLERSVLGFPAGLALLSMVTTAALFAKLPPAALIGVVLVFLAAAAAWGGKSALELLQELVKFARQSPVLAAVIGVSALLGLVGCMAPETGWDTGVYHFTMARLRAEQGGMVVRLDVLHGYRPAYMESLYTVGFLLNGETLASIVNLLFYVAGLAIARMWGIRLAGARGGTFAALAWMSSITYVLRMDGGDVEVGQTVFLGVALIALLKLRDGASGRWRIVAGVALGMLLGIKYPSIFIVAPLALTWGVLRVIDRASWRGLLLDVAVVAGLGLLIAAPFYVRNRLETGAFYFPLSTASGPDAVQEPHPERMGFTGFLQMIAMDGFILAGVAALFMKITARDRWAGIVALLTAGFFLRMAGVTVAAYSNAWRYATPAWLPLLAFGGAAVAVLYDRGAVARVLGVAGILCALALGQGVLAKRNLPKLPVAVGIQDRDTYLASKVNTYRAIRDAEAGLPPGKRILLVEERVYYCRAPFLAASDIQRIVDWDAMKTEADLRRFLTEQSIGAIVVDRSPGAKTWRFRNMETRLGAAWPPPNVRHVPAAEASSLYRVE